MAVQTNSKYKKINPNPWQVCVYNQDGQTLRKDCEAFKKKKNHIFLIKTVVSLFYVILFIDNLLLTLIQSGEYFGAEVCTMDVDGDTFTDLILISAPMHVDTDREGRVHVCSLSGLVNDKVLFTFIK